MHFPFERIFESKTEQTEQKCTFIAMYILDYQQKNNMCTLSYIETVRIRGLRYPLTVVRSGPHSGSPMKEKARLTLIAVSSLFEKTEGAGMEIISFLLTQQHYFLLNIETHTHEHWFALKVFYNKVFEIEDILKKDKIETYIPCEETLMERNGIKKKLRRPVINSLMFFRSTVCRALEVQRQFTNKVILYTRQKGLKRLPLAIPDREMNIFMLVTSSGEQGMEYFGEDNSKFHQGERVRVIDGKFKGAEGVICRIRKNRRLVVTVQGVCAVATSYIPQAFLQRIGQD